MTQYRKKPVVVDAVQWFGKFTDGTEWPDWFRAAAQDGGCMRWGEGRTLEIATLEGVMTAAVGDYVIRGVKGELYPCKADIFEMTYEPAVESVP